MNIIDACLHQIDTEENRLKHIELNSENEDLSIYVQKTLEEINKREQKRKFGFSRETTEFFNLLKNVNTSNDFSADDLGKSFAERLLEKEIEAEERYGHLSQGGLLKRGSFLQLLYRNESNEIFYLGVKVDHQEFLDEEDFTKKIGLSYTKKAYKACSVCFDTEGTPLDIVVYDTNANISKYWYQNFLELKELRTNERNTETAFKRVNQVLGRIKEKHPEDYTILRNSTISAFQQQGNMDYPSFIESTFTNYSPTDSSFQESYNGFVAKLTALPEEYDFDTQFELAPSIIKSRKTVYKLSDEIDLTLKSGVQNLKDKVWSQRTSCGKEVVVIDSPEGYKRFENKEVELV